LWPGSREKNDPSAGRRWVNALTVHPVAARTAARVSQSANPVSPYRSKGIERSMTFRELIEAIGATDGMVYIHDGKCGRSVRACLHLSVAINGPYRYLRILVDLRKAPDCELVASIGHELQHALEALGNPRVRSTPEIFHFFHRRGPTESGTFETIEAVETGLQVEREACRNDRQP
jgi:hypothetical protein